MQLELELEPKSETNLFDPDLNNQEVNKIIEKIELDTVYTFDLTGQVKFSSLPEDVLYDIFKDGRAASKFFENILPFWFPELKYVDKKGYDHIHVITCKRYDLKGFTHGGASYAPSNMIGGSRTINEEEMHSHASTIDYIFSDIVEFPKIKIIFKSGVDLITNYPTGKIPFADRKKFFNT